MSTSTCTSKGDPSGYRSNEDGAHLMQLSQLTVGNKLCLITSFSSSVLIFPVNKQQAGYMINCALLCSINYKQVWQAP